MTHILIPREPSTALLRPFIGCNTQELHEAWAAMVRIAEVQHARAGSECLQQIEEPATLAGTTIEQYARMFDAACKALGQISDCLDINSDINPGAEPIIAAIEQLRAGNTHPVLNDRWKARMLDGRAIERDEMGLGDHPELPWLDEGMMPRSFYAALGLELAHTMAEDQLDGDALEAMSEAVNWTAWQPTAPQSDGWKLVSIFDTEDGPAAWWLRELPEAEDGTTTIRNLKAEVEKLEARIARLSRAGAAPAAVAPASGDIDWDVLPENPGERARFDRQLSQLHGGDPRVFIATSLRLWAETRGGGFFGAQCAVFANEVAKMHIAVPALEAPAAPATPEQVQALHRARRALHAIGKTYDDSELRTQALEADEEIERMLAAASQAPAAPSDPLCWVFEDELPRSMTQDAYNALYPHSRVDTVRMFPIFGPAAPAAPAVDAWLQPDDMAALQRFHETAEDNESYDIGKEAVARLCAFGCLQSHSFGRYSTTDFGDYLLDTWAGARTLPFTTAAEREASAAQAKEGGA